MERTKSDIANSALRIFLQDVGKFYDSARGYEPYRPKKAQKTTLLENFNYKCCYCDAEINEHTLSQDHLIPMNKASLGLHAWGNVVPCCKDCNNEKQQKHWNAFLRIKVEGKLYQNKKKKIDSFVKKMRYDPNLNLHKYTDNLYEDIGEVALTLIKLRYKQAEEDIKKVIIKNRKKARSQ